MKNKRGMNVKILILILAATISALAQADIETLFHPYDSTLKKIATEFSKTKKTIDIALYNIDSTKSNPVIAFLASPGIQKKIQTKKIKVRLLFEGYAHKNENLEKMLDIEKLGVDVRHMGSSRKMHHKFAIIDGGGTKPKLINGSANWSLSSRKFYNENILFFNEQPALARSFQDQFNFLWSLSKEVGFSTSYTIKTLKSKQPDLGVQSFFNTENFIVKKNKLYKSKTKPGFHLTNKIVKEINLAEDNIKIATTRMKLRPIYNALIKAAARGVKIDIIVTMGEYLHKGFREKLELPNCPEQYKSSCSSGVNYAYHLNLDNFKGHENVNVRLKFFHMNTTAYLDKQMHSKYMIVDNRTVLTGSFNWSYSAEFNHVENIMDIDGEIHPEVRDDFNADFNYMWELGRHKYKSLINTYESRLKKKKKISCSFSPMVLKFEEIDYLLRTPYRVAKKRSLKSICE